jgi:hypothetical protein
LAGALLFTTAAGAGAETAAGGGAGLPDSACVGTDGIRAIHRTIQLLRNFTVFLSSRTR